jgi:hypothetical protein
MAGTVLPGGRAPGPPIGHRVHRLRRAGLLFVALPAGAFALFALGEALALETAWWSHLLQLAIVALLALVGWLRPNVGGPLLTIVGAGVTTLVLIGSGGSLATRLATIAVFFAPLIAAGVCFTLVARPDDDVPQR